MQLEEVELFGKKFLAKGYCCNTEGTDEVKNENTKLNLYISINDVCNAKCKFCNVHTKKSCNAKFDVKKLEEVLIELKNKERLNRIGITGGETFLNINLLNDILKCIKDNIEYPFVTINTNGSFLHKINEIKYLDIIEGIHISRHHYDDNKNNEIFGIKTASMKEIKEVNTLYRKELIRLNCLLIKGYIDNYEEIKKYLDIATESDIFRVGFVGLMPLNEYCKENYVDFKQLGMNDYILKTGSLKDMNLCECNNYTYCSKETKKLIDVYFRQVKELNCEYCRQLTYSCDNKLLVGFNKEEIY